MKFDRRPALEQLDDVAIDEIGKNTPNNTVGFSQYGEVDERTLWHEFRWSFEVDDHSPDRCRIFRRGLQIEKDIISDFRKANFRVFDRDDDGNQMTYHLLGGHFKGKIDLVVMDIPGLEKGAHAGEIKAINKTDFNRLVKVGLKHWNDKYYAQVQAAIAATETKQGFLIAECRETGRRHIDYVDHDEHFWFGALAKVRRVISRKECPPSAYKESDKEVARFMKPEKRRVYLGKALPKPNCRNCNFSEAIIDDSKDAQWVCHQHKETLALERQRTACSDHVFLPSLIPPNASKLDTDSWSLAALTKTVDINDTIIAKFGSKEIDDVIAVNSGKPAKEVRCCDCQHYEPNANNTQGMGSCKVESPSSLERACYPKRTRNCTRYLMTKQLFKVDTLCPSKSITLASGAVKSEKSKKPK